ASQSAKRIQVDGLCPLTLQVRVDEREVGELILSVIVNILGHVTVQILKGSCILWIPAPPRNFAILDSSEFVVLLPKISFEGFKGGQESENGHISFGETDISLMGEG